MGKREKELQDLAQGGGNDASLVLFDKINEVEDTLDSKITAVETTLTQKVSALETELSKEPVEDMKIAKIAERMALKMTVERAKFPDGKDGHTPTPEELTALIKPLIPPPAKPIKGDDGHTPTTKELLSLIEPLIPEPLPATEVDEEILVAKLTEQLPQFGETFRDGLELLQGEERLKKSAIQGLEFIEEEIAQLRDDKGKFIGPSRGIFLYINGAKKGLVNSMNIVGTGVATSVVNGLLTITITGGTGGSSIETPTGSVNGVNTVFTVLTEPLYIIVDGISKFVTTHYTYVAGTITITDGAPPTSFIRTVI